MEELNRLFRLAADHAAGYRRSLPDRAVGAQIDQAALLKAFSGPLPSASSPPEQVLADLLVAAEPGLVASAGPRYFGFVAGGALPAATAADILAAEAAAGTWLKELLGVPASASVGFVPAAKRLTPPGSRPPGTRCWRTWVGTWNGTGCSGRRRSG